MQKYNRLYVCASCGYAFVIGQQTLGLPSKYYRPPLLRCLNCGGYATENKNIKPEHLEHVTPVGYWFWPGQNRDAYKRYGKSYVDRLGMVLKLREE